MDGFCYAQLGKIPSERIISFAVESQISLGGLAWKVIHTPGHDATIAVFHQPETRQLISSDALLIPTPTPVVETPPLGQPRQPSLPHMLESMQQLAQLGCRHCLYRSWRAFWRPQNGDRLADCAYP